MDMSPYGWLLAIRQSIFKYDFAISRRDAPEILHEHCPSRKEGAGNAGCTLHPRSRVQLCRESAHEQTGSAEAIRHSLRNGLTAYAVISPATNSSCHRRCRLDGGYDPVGSYQPPTAAPATGVGTTRFCRTLWRRSSCAPVDRSRETRPAIFLRADAAASTAPSPAFRDDHDTPLVPGKDGASW